MDNNFTNEFSYEMINLNKIIPNKDNFYSINKESIRSLADTISEVGLLHDIVVMKIENDSKNRYKIISGERRYRAIKLLNSENKYSNIITCKVLKSIDDIDSQIALIRGNSNTRELSTKEKRKQIKRLEILYNEKQNNSGIKMPVQKLVAEDLGMSPRNIRRISKINYGLIDELKEFYDSNKISLINAEKFARFDKESQYIILEGLKTGVTLTQEQIESIKKENTVLMNEICIKNDELNNLKSSLDKKDNEKLLLEKQLSEANYNLNNINNNINQIREKIKNEEKKENESKTIQLKADLQYLTDQLKKIKASKKSLEIDLIEKDLKIKSEKAKLENTIEELKNELTKKSEKIKFDANKKEEEIIKKINNNQAIKYKDDILNLIQKISELDFLEESNILFIKDEIKTFLKLLN